MTKLSYALAGVLGVSLSSFAADFTVHSWKKIQLSDQFWGEGANVGDFNKDGKMDVVSGPYWWEGPEFKVRHEYDAADSRKSPSGVAPFELKLGPMTKVTVPGFHGCLGKENAYSDNFFAFTHDINGDGWDDILIYGFPGKEAFWFENPQGVKNDKGAEHWERHTALDVVDNESPTWGDITGDGKPEIICNSGGYFGYATPDWKDATKKFAWHNVTPKGPWQRFTHGLGFGDINGDGKADLLEMNGWWEQPASLDNNPEWKNHKVAFAPNSGSAQMFAYDVNGDGRNDVITSLAAHGYGLAWYEQLAEKDDKGSPKFAQRLIIGKNPSDNKYGVKFSQLHAVDLVDVDGDGLKDIITGKRIWAHGPAGDVEPTAPAVLYWFKLTRNGGNVEYIPYQIDNDSGIGTQVVSADVNGDKRPDIVVGNKKGTFVFIQSAKNVSKAEWEKAQPKPIVQQTAAR
jgi:hypothetical protein